MWTGEDTISDHQTISGLLEDLVFGFGVISLTLRRYLSLWCFLLVYQSNSLSNEHFSINTTMFFLEKALHFSHDQQARAFLLMFIVKRAGSTLPAKQSRGSFFLFESSLCSSNNRTAWTTMTNCPTNCISSSLGKHFERGLFRHTAVGASGFYLIREYIQIALLSSNCMRFLFGSDFKSCLWDRTHSSQHNSSSSG